MNELEVTKILISALENYIVAVDSVKNKVISDYNDSVTKRQMYDGTPGGVEQHAVQEKEPTPKNKETKK